MTTAAFLYFTVPPLSPLPDPLFSSIPFPHCSHSHLIQLTSLYIPPAYKIHMALSIFIFPCYHRVRITHNPPIGLHIFMCISLLQQNSTAFTIYGYFSEGGALVGMGSDYLMLSLCHSGRFKGGEYSSACLYAYVCPYGSWIRVSTEVLWSVPCWA